jgi:hypothetical protein
MDPSQLQRIEKKLDRLLDETSDLRLRMSLLEQRLTIFDARLDRLDVRLDKIDQRVDHLDKKPALEEAPARAAAVTSDLLSRQPAPPPQEHGPRPVPTLIKEREREQDDNWFEKHLQQQLEEDRRYRSESAPAPQHRAFTRFDRG